MRSVQVLVEARAAHLSRVLDYGVPGRLDGRVVVGCRVRVPLAGRVVSGIVVAEGASAGFDGRALPIRSVVSQVPVLTPEIIRLAAAVARHYAGTLADVVRFALPPRVASQEAGFSATAAGAPDPQRPAVAAAGLAASDFITAAVAGRPVRSAWVCPPGIAWQREVLEAARCVAAGGKGVLLVVPDQRDVASLADAAGDLNPAVLRADDGDAARYRQFLDVLGGGARVVIGTRAAAFAPLVDPGLFVLWDDGDPVLAEPQTPYHHSREVLALRSHQQRVALLVAGHSRSPETQRLVQRGWLDEVDERARIRAKRPQLVSTVDAVDTPVDRARAFPGFAVRLLRDSLRHGPVLIAVAESGRRPGACCAACGAPARCPVCNTAVPFAGSLLRCDQGHGESAFACPDCGGQAVREVRFGAARIRGELPGLFRDVPVLVRSGPDPVTVPPGFPGLVVATPGLEPAMPRGYAAAYLPDAARDLWRPGFRARADAVRRWCNVGALVRADGRVIVHADRDDAMVAAFLRWDPIGAADLDLARRTETGMPPVVRTVQVEGAPDVVRRLVDAVGSRADDVLGPVPVGDGRARALLRGGGQELVDAVRTGLDSFSVEQMRGLRVQVDPIDLH